MLNRGSSFAGIGLIVVLFLAGCAATASVARYPNANYAPTDPGQVGVFTNYPPVAYEVIGEIEGEGVPGSNWGQVSSEMRKKAATIGGDAVVILVKDNPYVGTAVRPMTIQGTSTTTPAPANSGGSLAWQQSTQNYSFTPPSSEPMFGKYARGVVIRYAR